MKHLFFILIALTLFSCKQNEKKESVYPDENSGQVTEGETAPALKPEELGKAIFEGKGNCIACHKADQKLVGPSLQEIAKIYKEKNGDIPTFLKGKADPLVDPSQYEVMKTNFYITKNFSDEELKGLEAYIYSTLK